MNIIDGMIKELQHETATTRRVLERVPAEHMDFKPHEKSFSMGELASHIANSVGWAGPTCQMDRFEFDAAAWKPWAGKDAAEIVAKLDENLDLAVGVMQPLSNEDLFTTWSMVDPQGKTIIEMPRIQVLRAMILNHMIHHRGQLTVYLRMNDVPLPSIYGPSADEQG